MLTRPPPSSEQPAPEPSSLLDLGTARPPNLTTPATELATLELGALFAALESTREGLDTAEAQRRQAARAPRKVPPRLAALAAHAFTQLADPAHLVLLASAMAATVLGAPSLAIAIVVITLCRVLLLAGIATYADDVQRRLAQGRRARVRVRRHGLVQEIDAAALVLGDVVELSAGAQVPADLRLFESNALIVNSVPVVVDMNDVTQSLVGAGAWVSSGSGVGVVIAAPSDEAQTWISAKSTTDPTAPPDTEPEHAEPEHAAPTARFVTQQLTRSNLVVLGVALVVLFAGLLRGAGVGHSALSAVVLAAWAWSAHGRLALPLERLTLARALARLMALGVYVRGVDEMHRLAEVPIRAEEAQTPPAHPMVIAGSDDTDHARHAADVLFNQPIHQTPNNTAIASLAFKATQIARSVHAGAVRVWSYGHATVLALLICTAVQAVFVMPPWPASVPLALHLLLLTLCSALAWIPVRGAASRNALNALNVLNPINPLNPLNTLVTATNNNMPRMQMAWTFVLTSLVVLMLRGAPHVQADRASAVFALIALGSIAWAWVALLMCGGAGWRLRRLAVAHFKEVLRFLPITVLGTLAVLASVHVPRLQGALELMALPKRAWGVVGGFTLAAVVLMLALLLVLERGRKKARTPNATSTTLPAIAVLTPTLALTLALLATAPIPTLAQEKNATRPALSVTLTTLQAMDWPHVLTANGNIAAWQEAVIGAEISNYRLLEVRANVGDWVRKGQLLAQIANDTLAAELAQSQALQAEAEAQLAEAKANADRARSLQPTGVLSAQQITQLLTAEQTAAARLNSARARVKVDALRLAQTRVVAPDDGLISARTATVGSLTQPGQELFRLIRGGRLEWRAEVTAAELMQLKPGQRAYVTAPNGQRAESRVIEGRVRTVAPTVDAQSRTALVYVDLKTSVPTQAAASSDVRAGMYARGQFELGQALAQTLPQSAVLLRDGFSYVFVLGADERVMQQKVTVGRRRAERIEILSGLDSKASVVATGAGFLTDGDKVRVIPAKSAAQ